MFFIDLRRGANQSLQLLFISCPFNYFLLGRTSFYLVLRLCQRLHTTIWLRVAFGWFLGFASRELESSKLTLFRLGR